MGGHKIFQTRPERPRGGSESRGRTGTMRGPPSGSSASGSPAASNMGESEGPKLGHFSRFSQNRKWHDFEKFSKNRGFQNEKVRVNQDSHGFRQNRPFPLKVQTRRVKYPRKLP